MHDFYFDQEEVSFKQWADFQLDDGKMTNYTAFNHKVNGEVSVPTIDMLKYSHIIKLLTKSQSKSILLIGSAGTSKSTHLLNIDTAPLSLKSTTSAYDLQQAVEGKLSKIRKNLLGSVSRHSSYVIGIDDVNMPIRNSGQSPPI